MDAQSWDDRYAGTELVWSAGPNQFVESELAELPPGAAYDMGAGEGRNAIWLAGRGWTVSAADFSRVALDKGREAARAGSRSDGPAIRWVVADVVREGPEPDCYDLVLVAYLQLPPKQRREALINAARGLRVGGTLLVIAHDTTNLTEGVGGPQDREVLYTAADVLDDLADIEGLVTERAECVHRSVNVEGIRRTARDAVVRLRRIN